VRVARTCTSINDLFQDAVLKMIAKRPEDRFQTPADLLRALEHIGLYNNLEADRSDRSRETLFSV
jgi:hypothetical protein